MDVTQVPTVWYQWNGSHYAKVSIIGSAGNLNTLVNDLVSNNSNDTAAQDRFRGNRPHGLHAAGGGECSGRNGSVILQPGVGRTPFTNTGNYRVQDNRTDVPATARGVTEFGAACDTRQVYGYLTSGSTAFSIGGGALTSADIGRSIVAVGLVGGMPTQFESVIAGITDSLHGTLTTAAPFTQATQHQMDLGHE